MHLFRYIVYVKEQILYRGNMKEFISNNILLKIHFCMLKRKKKQNSRNICEILLIKLKVVVN